MTVKRDTAYYIFWRAHRSGRGMALAATLLAGTATLSASQETSLGKPAIERLQHQLTEIGFNTGGADGIAGARTLAAIDAFLRDFGPDQHLAVSEEVAALVEAVHESRFMLVNQFDKRRLFMPEREIARVDLTEHRNSCLPPVCEPMDSLLAILDLNADGLKDLVYGVIESENGMDTLEAGPIVFLVNTGDGSFEVDNLGLELDMVHPREGVVADFNGDGADDLFIVGAGMDMNPFPGEQNLLLLSSGSEMTDATQTHLPQRIDFSHGAGAGDLDGDGDVDILVMTHVGKAVFVDSYVLENDGHGAFTINDEPDYISASLLSTRSEGADYSNNSTVRIADYDGDGSLDIAWLAVGDEPELAASKSGAQMTHITYNDGSNRYLSQNTLDLPLHRWGHRTFVTDLHQLDFDGDGDMDLMASTNTRTGDSWRGNFIEALENRGHRTFVNVTHERLFAQGYENASEIMWNYWLFPVDLDLDGRSDLVTYTLDPVVTDFGNYETPFKVALQQPDGKLIPIEQRSLVTADYSMRRIRPVDIDNDGDLDLVGSRLLRGPFAGDEAAFKGFIVQVLTNMTSP